MEIDTPSVCVSTYKHDSFSRTHIMFFFSSLLSIEMKLSSQLHISEFIHFEGMEMSPYHHQFACCCFSEPDSYIHAHKIVDLSCSLWVNFMGFSFIHCSSRSHLLNSWIVLIYFLFEVSQAGEEREKKLWYVYIYAWACS